MSKKTNNLVLSISGGMGKTLMATAVVRNYKLKFPDSKVVVVSSYPEVFINNPDVYRNFSFSQAGLWKDYYSPKTWKVFAHDPYMTQSWIKNENLHLTEIWSRMLRVPHVQKTPLLYFSSPELDELQKMIATEKALMVVQSTGGSNPALRSWTRTPPQNEFNDFLGRFKETHYIVHLCLPETPVLSNVHQRIDNFNRRQALCLVHYAQEFVGIDSFGMHARASNPASGPTVIFFPLAESIDRLGYQKNNWYNIAPVQEVQDMLNAHSDYYASVFKFNIEDDSSNCPVPVGTRWFQP